jgi:ParB family transcriptional regulator, chromosome partitioning protein
MQKVTETGKKRTVLGQGLNALIPFQDFENSRDLARTVTDLRIDSLLPNRYQPRRHFSEETLAELSRSLLEVGVIQPLIVRPLADGRYEIVAGERRWRAAIMAGFSTIPALVQELTDSESLERALIENIQREDLNPLDTAEAYDMLIKKFSYTHENLAQRIGQDRSNITNYLRLLKLPDPVKQYLRDDLISMGHARTLLAIENISTQLNLSNRVVKRKLSVRDLEKIVQNFKKKQAARSSRSPARDEDLKRLENALSRYFSTKVSIRQIDNEQGRLEIHYHSRDEFDRLLELMGCSPDFS